MRYADRADRKLLKRLPLQIADDWNYNHYTVLKVKKSKSKRTSRPCWLVWVRHNIDLGHGIGTVWVYDYWPDRRSGYEGDWYNCYMRRDSRLESGQVTSKVHKYHDADKS